MADPKVATVIVIVANPTQPLSLACFVWSDIESVNESGQLNVVINDDRDLDRSPAYSTISSEHAPLGTTPSESTLNQHSIFPSYHCVVEKLFVPSLTGLSKMALPPADLLPTSSEVLEALKLDRVYDHMRLADNSQLQNLFKKELKKNDMQMEIEHLNFSASVTKINRHGKLQERALVMTNRAIYNFKKHKYSSCKRRIPIQVLSGLVLSRQSTEVVFQIGDDYDYR